MEKDSLVLNPSTKSVLELNEKFKIFGNIPITNIKNPYLQIKREFIDAITNKTDKNFVRAVSKSLMWFYITPYRDDWVT